MKIATVRASVVVERVEIRQESVGKRGRQIDRLATRGAGARAICRIKWIGHQYRRFSAAAPT